jgi:hypothetical protein
MLKLLFAALIISLSTVSYSAVRFNYNTGFWEGNICANNYAWTYVPWQPIGSFCFIRYPNGQLAQGIIVNQ